MANKSKDEELPTEYDPKVEAKVDALMNNEEPVLQNKDQVDVEPELSTSASAPLLPGEKLPNLNKKPEPKPEIVQESSPAEPAPAVLGGLVNNVPNNKTEDQSINLDDKLDDEDTGEVVDEIVSSESDRILAIEDAKAELVADGDAEVEKTSAISKFFGGLGRLFRSKAFKIVFFVLLIGGLAGAFVYPDSRYYILNKAGVRATTTLKIVDEQTVQPLKNAEVTIGNVSSTSDDNGNVTLNEVMLGEQEITVTKPAFANYSQPFVVGWGSNPQGEVGLISTGTRYTFQLNDFLSGEPIKNSEAKSGEASAKSNDKGEIVLVVEDNDKDTVEAEISADGYRTEKITLKIGDEEPKKIILVPSKKHAFVSKRDGTFDLYKIDVDGKNEEKILDGTGNEREDQISILVHSNQNVIAFVSTRTDERTKDGQPIVSLNIVNLRDNSVEEVVESERIQLVDFIDDKLIYVKTELNADDEDKKRNRLVAYDLNTLSEQELDSTNYFNDVLSANGAIYYSPAEFNVNGSVGFYSINPDGSNKSAILAKEAWSLSRIAFDKVNVSIADDWYQYDLNTAQLDRLNGAPASQSSRIYTISPDGKKAIWIDERDGKGVLIVYDVETGKEKILQRQSGLANPVTWLDGDHVIYRVANSNETADYIVSTSGGEPQKIIDVTNTVGLDRFYLY